MGKIPKAVILIPYNSKKEILLQLRDEEPEIDRWVCFGGKVEDGEEVEETLIREIKEELDWDLTDEFENVGIYPVSEVNPRELHVFAARLENIDG
jgi:8-oxo-dGTP pyrophosphatase MutT (NUDIX family)